MFFNITFAFKQINTNFLIEKYLHFQNNKKVIYFNIPLPTFNVYVVQFASIIFFFLIIYQWKIINVEVHCPVLRLAQMLKLANPLCKYTVCFSYISTIKGVNKQQQKYNNYNYTNSKAIKYSRLQAFSQLLHTASEFRIFESHSFTNKQM